MEQGRNKKVNIKRIYSKEDLDPEIRFLDYPSCSAQKYIGETARNLSSRKDISQSNYPNYEYKYIGKLSDGSASKLYKAKVTKDSYKDVVIKRIPKNEEWRTELNILRKLKDSSFRIINFVDFYESDRCVYIVTDLYGGFDLFEHIDINVPYSEDYSKKLIIEMLLCLKECHDRNIAHLDIKCENYMVKKMDPPSLILIDFGHAEYIPSNTMREGISSYGTCFYLCPEGYKKYYSMKSDSWSIGICAHLLLTGDYPFQGDDDEYEYNVCKGNIKISRKINGEALDFVQKCLIYDPKYRFDIYQLLNHPWLVK